jgi:hypothetical protein
LYPARGAIGGLESNKSPPDTAELVEGAPKVELGGWNNAEFEGALTVVATIFLAGMAPTLTLAVGVDVGGGPDIKFELERVRGGPKRPSAESTC